MDFKSILTGAIGSALLFTSVGATIDDTKHAKSASIDENLLITTDELQQYRSYRLGGASVIDGTLYQVVELESTHPQMPSISYPFRLIRCNRQAN